MSERAKSTLANLGLAGAADSQAHLSAANANLAACNHKSLQNAEWNQAKSRRPRTTLRRPWRALVTFIRWAMYAP